MQWHISISFNAAKSKCIHFSYKKTTINNSFTLNDKRIPAALHEKHLGNIIGSNAHKISVDNAIHELYQNVNILISQFSHTSMATRYSLFKTFCMSAYGSQLWNFESKDCNKFYTAWRKCICRIFQLPNQTQSYLLHAM